LGDSEVVGLDAAEGGQLPAEDMIFAMEGAGFFEEENVGGMLDDAEEGGFAAGVGADEAGLAFGEGAALLAGVDIVAGGNDIIGEAAGEFGVSLDDVEGDAFSGSGADAGEFGEGRNELEQWLGEEGHGVT
jgi:hypothetical protein